MDVTAEILQNIRIYGSSDSTAPAGLSSSRSLNYASGPSITRPDNISISLIPYALKYQDAVGLFGAENYFVKVNISVDLQFVTACFEEKYWQCAVIKEITDTDPYYTAASIDTGLDLITVNSYEPAEITVPPRSRLNSYVSIDLNNLKTGNKHIDNWLDIRLYTADRKEHPFDKMYVREKSYFYLGIHARNTRRLPYNIECLIGNEYIGYADMDDEERKYIAKTIS